MDRKKRYKTENKFHQLSSRQCLNNNYCIKININNNYYIK